MLLAKRQPASAAVAACFVLCFANAVEGATVRGTVVHVTDGDTVVMRGLEGEFRIRLAAIDSPEREQPGYEAARKSLASIAGGKDVTVIFTKVDDRGRLVGRVFVNGREDAGLEQIRRGYAWHFKRYAAEQSGADRTAYAAAEKAARSQRAGLWSRPNPMPPWQYREGARSRSSVPKYGASMAQPAGPVIGNRRSRIYHLPDCPGYTTVAPTNRRYFGSPQEAERAGFQKAKNCPK